jgi:hypothetical protein
VQQLAGCTHFLSTSITVARLIRPRLNDYYDLPFSQEDVDFFIPLLDDDIPLHPAAFGG